MCAKKGRVARILTTLHRVAGTPISEALKRRQRAAVQRGDAGTHGGDKSEWRKRKERERRKSQFEGAATQTGLPQGYHSGQNILLVGEGNLSFALALVTLFDGEGGNILATSLDRQGIARSAYPDCEDVEETLRASGTGVRFGVDVEDPDVLKRVAKEWWAAGDEPNDRTAAGGGGGGGGSGGGSGGHGQTVRGGGGGAGPGGFFRGFDRVVWNFPDRGVGTVGALAVRANQDALAAFFREAKGLLAKEGEVHVAMVGDAARATWNVAGVAARGGLAYRASLDFAPDAFPGYQHFRTLPHPSLLRRRGAADDGEGKYALDDESGDDDEGDGEREVVEAAEDDVAVGAKTLIFQVDRDAGGGGRGKRE